MRHQRGPEWASQETASGLQNGCRVFAHCTDLLPLIPHQSAGSCRPWPPSPARRKSPSPRCERAVRAGCSCTAGTTAEATRSPSVQIDGPTRCSCPISSRGLEADWMYGAVVYVDRERRSCAQPFEPVTLVTQDPNRKWTMNMAFSKSSAPNYPSWEEAATLRKR